MQKINNKKTKFIRFNGHLSPKHKTLLKALMKKEKLESLAEANRFILDSFFNIK